MWRKGRMGETIFLNNVGVIIPVKEKEEAIFGGVFSSRALWHTISHVHFAFGKLLLAFSSISFAPFHARMNAHA